MNQELVVLLPAVGYDSTCWGPQEEFLRSRKYNVIAVEYPRTTPETTFENVFSHIADEVAATIRSSGYSRAHIVGISMGGHIALELFRRHPSTIRSIVLANTNCSGGGFPDTLAWFKEFYDKVGLPSFSESTLSNLFSPDTDREIVSKVCKVESSKDPMEYRKLWEAMLTLDLRAILPTLDVPVLLIGGEIDVTTPSTPLLTSIRDAFPAARLVILPKANHFSNLDNPFAFNTALLAHLVRARSKCGDRLDAPSSDSTINVPAGTTAEQLLRHLNQRGVELFASNSGTDFTPIIDALANLEDDADFHMKVFPAPHENTGVSMAHGHALISRRPQVVMAHVTVGTANMGLGLINARRAHVPMLMLSGRTPLYEGGMAGVRTNFVQWGQESYDQSSMFREYTKWDYELRSHHAMDTLLDRGMSIAASEPSGPVYLVLPKEPLCSEAPAHSVSSIPRQTPTMPGAAPLHLLQTAATWIGRAKKPLIVTADMGRHAGGAEALISFAHAIGAGIVEFGKRNFFNAPTEDAYHLGFEPLPFMRETDLVLAIECPVPYIPAFAPGLKVPPFIQIGIDPLFSDLPARGFPVDLGLSGDPVETLRALKRMVVSENGVLPLAWSGRHETAFNFQRQLAEGDSAKQAITKNFLSLCIGKAIDDETIIVNEYNCDPWLVPRNTSDSWFENSVASGLGWALGAAIGIKLAAPSQTVVVTLGDGSYLFNTPLSAHMAARSEDVAMLIVVFNDQAWSTIKKSTRGSHPQGHAVRTGKFALCDFSVEIAYDQIAVACGAIGLRASTPSELPAKIEEGLRYVREEGKLVLLNVICERDA